MKCSQTMKNAEKNFNCMCGKYVTVFRFRFVLMFNDVLKLTLQLIQNTKYTFY